MPNPSTAMLSPQGRLIAVFLLLAAAIGAIGGGAYASLSGALREREHERLGAVADLKTKQIENWLAERYGDARVLADSALLDRLFTTLDKPQTLRHLDKVRAAYHYSSIELFDSSGRKILASGTPLHAGLDRDEVLRLGLAAEGEPALVDFHRESTPGRSIGLAIAVAVPGRPGDAGRPAGFVLLTVDPGRHLFPMIRAWPSPSASAESLLVRREGNEVAFINKLRHSDAPPLSLRFPLSQTSLPAVQAVLGATGLVEGRDYRNVPVMASVRPIAGTPWRLLTKVDQAEVYGDIRVLGGLVTTGVLLVIAGAAAILFMLWRRQQLAASLAIAEKDNIVLSMIDNAADAVFIAAPQGRYRYINRELVNLAGYSREDMLSMDIADLFPTAAHGHSQFFFAELLKERKHLRVEAPLRHKEGHSIPVEINAVALPDGTLFGSCRDITERERMMTSLREERNFIDAVLQAAGTAVVVLDREGRVVRFNRAAEEMTGYSFAELQNRQVWDYLIPPEQQAGVRGVFDNLMHDTIIGSYENEWLTKDGSRRLLAWRNTVLRDAGGKVEHVVALGYDISELRANEARMRLDAEQQTALTDLLENALRGEALDDTLQFCLDRVLAVSWLSLLPKGGVFLREADAPCLRMAASRNLTEEVRASCGHLPLGYCLCGRVAASGKILFASHTDERHEIHYPGMADHGHYIVPLLLGERTIGVLALYLPPATAPDPRKEQFLSSVAGILAAYIGRSEAERELAENRGHLEEMVRKRTAELAMNEARTRAILRTMMDGVLQIDAGGNILTANDAVHEMFGYENGELVGRDVAMLMPEPYRRRHEQGLRGYDLARPSRVVGQRLEVEGLRRDGSTFPLDIAVHVIVDDAGMTFIGVLRDISQFKAAEAVREAALADAKRLARMKSEFLANMSHEIRTPLNAVLGLSKIGIRENFNRGTTDTFVRIQNAGQHLLGIINDILDLSKIEAGKLSVAKQAFRLGQAVEDALELVAKQAEAKGLALSAEQNAEMPQWVEGDRLRLEQVLLNLLANAIKFTESGEVTLAMSREGEYIRFAVRDTGIGMTVEEVARLFTPFEQIDNSTTRKFGGTGLGLAISRNLARIMGGDITVESRLGAGSVFTLRLPLPETAPEPVETATPPPSGRKRQLAGLRILAAEDVEINRLVLGDLLAHEGAQTVFAQDGQQAVDLVSQQGGAFDVVLMDIQMPVMDGFEATRRIHENAPRLPVIGLTAHALPEERELCLAAGMVEHVTKPVTPEVLIAAILAHAGTAVAADGAAPIDWEALSVRYDGRQDFIGKLLATFLESHRGIPERLRQAAGGRDLEGIRAIAHGLKGSAGNIEAVGVRDLARQTEEAARGAADSAPALAEELAGMLETLLAELDGRTSAKREEKVNQKTRLATDKHG